MTSSSFLTRPEVSTKAVLPAAIDRKEWFALDDSSKPGFGAERLQTGI